MIRTRRAVVLSFLAFVLSGACNRAEQAAAPPKVDAAMLRRELDEVRRNRDIPGLSAAVAVGDQVVWEAGTGLADVGRNVPATPQTVYHLASLTKPYAASVILQLVAEGRLSLDAPAARFGITDRPGATLRHILSHTSREPAGHKFRYDGGAFGELEKVVTRTTGRSFAHELSERILRPLALGSTAPNPLDTKDVAASGVNIGDIERRLARGYARKWGRSLWPTGIAGPMTPIDYPSYFGTSAGLVATAADVARFSAAFDAGEVVPPPMRDLAFTAARAPDGERLPYGLGWFVQEHEGRTIIWHYGHWFGISSVIIKVPSERLTFVALANSDGLSRRTRLGDDGDITASPLAPFFFELVLPAFGNRAT